MMGTMAFSLPTDWKADWAKAATSSSRSMLPLGFWAACRWADQTHTLAAFKNALRFGGSHATMKKVLPAGESAILGMHLTTCNS